MKLIDALTEIYEFEPAGDEQKVCRLEVRVDDGASVDDRHRVQHLRPVVLDHGRRDLLLVHILLEQAGEVSVALLHDDVEDVEVVILLVVVEPDDPVLPLQLRQQVDLVQVT